MKLNDWVGLVFVILKLTGYITWSWWWVVAPWWIGFPILGLILILKKIRRACMSKEARQREDLIEAIESYKEALTRR